jgi:hypothetical protein
VSGDREVQRTMLELLDQLDGFNSDDRIKVSLCFFFFFFFPFSYFYFMGAILSTLKVLNLGGA